MNSMKSQNDRILKGELPRSVCAQYAPGDQWRTNSRKNEGMEPKQKQYSSCGCDCAILACTELSVFATYHSLPPFYLDAMMVLAEESVKRCGYPLRTI